MALVAKAPLSVAINKNLPVNDLKSLIAYSKKSAQPLTFAVGSVGSAGHLATEALKRSAGLNYSVVPYKGTAPAFQDLVGGPVSYTHLDVYKRQAWSMAPPRSSACWTTTRAP